MQIVRVFKPQTERKNFFGVGVRNSGHRRQSCAAQKILKAKRQETEKETPLSSSFYHTKEEAWEDFDEHSQQ